MAERTVGKEIKLNGLLCEFFGTIVRNVRETWRDMGRQLTDGVTIMAPIPTEIAQPQPHPQRSWCYGYRDPDQDLRK